MRMRKRILFFFIIIIINRVIVIEGYEPEEVKVALILRILEYTHWSNIDTDSIFYMGVIGGGKILKYLNKIPDDYVIKGRKIKVNKISRNIKSIKKIKQYRVIVIPKEVKVSKKDIENIIKYNRNILLISEDIENCCDNILVSFFIKEGAIRFKIYFENMPVFNISFDETLLRYAYEK